jgi:hypothetical protein
MSGVEMLNNPGAASVVSSLAAFVAGLVQKQHGHLEAAFLAAQKLHAVLAVWVARLTEHFVMHPGAQVHASAFQPPVPGDGPASRVRS